MKRATGLFLGILTAVGGFIDMGGIIACAQAGARYRFSLLWTLIPGLIGLIIYAEMAGRVVIASGRTLFDVVRDRLGFRIALLTLGATLLVNTLTLFVELSGMSLALQVATHVSYLIWFPLAGLILGIILWKASFELLDDASALLGLTMLVSVVALVALHPPWGRVGTALVHPHLATIGGVPAYLFAAISLLGGYMTPYQFYFYSSGAVEEEWDGQDLVVNRATSIIGSIFGAVIALALIVGTGIVLFPQHQSVQTLVDAGLPVHNSLGTAGWALFLVGTFAVSMGAGLETTLSGAYALCQYMGWDWGKHGRPHQAPLFVLGYLVMLIIAVALAYTRIDPIKATILTLVLAAATLPVTFIPLLIVANDPEFVGDQHNTRSINVAALVILGLLVFVTVATVPLLIVTGGGS